eukprot:3265691-Prymnesium_polylepis.1
MSYIEDTRYRFLRFQVLNLVMLYLLNLVMLYALLAQESNTYQQSVSPFGDSRPRCPSQGALHSRTIAAELRGD